MPMPNVASAPVRRVALLTLGCKLNQAESDAIAGEFVARGCTVVDQLAAADAIVVNTCSVTHVADRKSRHLVRLARRLAPGASIIVTGCYPEVAGSEAARWLGADVVVCNGEKPSLVCRLLGEASGATTGVASTGLRTRAFVKIQEGCNDICAFCIVPRTRGRERSRPLALVVEEIRRRAAEGAQEVVLTGTQLGAYGRDSGASLPELIAAVLAGTDVPRIRVSSLQPQDLTPALLSLWQDRRLCRHFHLALQSGSDAVLGRMRRRYDTGAFARALASIRAAVPDVAVTTDVIVGFPGETDAEFEETLAFCRGAEFAAIHVFPYSRRSGTVAARMPQQVAALVKRERTRRLLALAAESARRYREQFIGRVETVLWERCRGGGNLPMWEGLTDTYLRVTAPSERDLRNRLTPARLLSQARGGFLGEVLT